MVGHLILTYNKIDDARINMEISKGLLNKEFGGSFLIHVFNGGKSVGYTKYLENILIERQNYGHFEGYRDSLNHGIKAAEKLKDIKYLIVTDCDTWFTNTKYIKNVIDSMVQNNQVLAVSAQDMRGELIYDKEYIMNLFKYGFATDFFILDMEWQRNEHLFPLRYEKVAKMFEPYKLFFEGMIVITAEIFSYEYATLFRSKYPKESHKYKEEMLAKLYHMIEREPKFYKGANRRWVYQREHVEMGVYGYHDDDVYKKRRLLEKLIDVEGKYIEKLRNANNLSYYNNDNGISYLDR